MSDNLWLQDLIYRNPTDAETMECPRCGGDHAWCQWVQPGEFGEES